MFGASFFLTFYLQQTLGYSPIETGLAFLPQVAAIMATGPASSALLLPRTGPRPLVTAGMVLAAAGMVILTQLHVDSTYAAHVLPGLVVTGLGLGLVIAPAINTATLGVAPADAGVASATVNTMQQIGGSLGTALLSTLSASAAGHYLAGRQHTADVVAHATVPRLRRRVLVGGRLLRRRRRHLRAAAAPARRGSDAMPARHSPPEYTTRRSAVAGGAGRRGTSPVVRRSPILTPMTRVPAGATMGITPPPCELDP